MKITTEWLRARDCCRPAYKVFRKVFPDGMQLNYENLKKWLGNPEHEINYKTRQAWLSDLIVTLLTDDFGWSRDQLKFLPGSQSSNSSYTIARELEEYILRPGEKEYKPGSARWFLEGPDGMGCPTFWFLSAERLINCALQVAERIEQAKR